jgi:hypothetical protein
MVIGYLDNSGSGEVLAASTADGLPTSDAAGLTRLIDIKTAVEDIDSYLPTTRTTNPGPYANGIYANPGLDDLGRSITRPIQVRDLIQTAYVSKTSGSTFGSETTLLAAAAGFYYDLIYVAATNDSSVAISCDFRDVTGGNVVFNLRIPANGTTGFTLPVPLPQGYPGNNWTIDLDDVTGTNIKFSALFSKEI